MIQRSVSRRRWLQAMGVSAATLPLVPITQSEAAEGPPRRLVFFFTPNGFYRAGHEPTGTGQAFTLGASMEPLAAYKDELLILQGLDNEAYYADPHPSPDHGFRLSLMTGTPTVFLGVNDESGKNINRIGGISIDQFIAQRLGSPTIFESLNLGILANPISDTRKVWATGAEQPVSVVDDPAFAHGMLFDPLDFDPAEEARMLTRRQSVIDTNRGELDRLLGKIGKEDKTKLQAHLEGLDQIEQRLGGTGCAPIELRSASDYPENGTLMMDMLAAALACDLSRVAVLNWSGPSSSQTFPWLDVNCEWHPLAHQSSTAREQAGWSNQDQLYEGATRVNAWHAEQLAYFLAKLEEYDEGDGTLRDNTIVLWCTDQGQGPSGEHDRRDVPMTIVGGGGYFDTGRVIDYGSRPLNDLYVSLCQAMGVDVDTFGLPAICGGPLPDLV